MFNNFLIKYFVDSKKSVIFAGIKLYKDIGIIHPVSMILTLVGD